MAGERACEEGPYQARLLTMLVLVLVPSTLMMDLLPFLWSGGPVFDVLSLWISAGVLGVAGAALVLNQASRYGAAVAALCFGLVATLLASQALTSLGCSSLYVADNLGVLYCGVIPVMLAGILCSLRFQALVLGVYVAGLVLLGVALEAIGWQMLLDGPLAFTLIVGALALVTTYHRDQMEAIRQAALLQVQAQKQWALKESVVLATQIIEAENGCAT